MLLNRPRQAADRPRAVKARHALTPHVRPRATGYVLVMSRGRLERRAESREDVRGVCSTPVPVRAAGRAITTPRKRADAVLWNSS